jgi:hypothetical protein
LDEHGSVRAVHVHLRNLHLGHHVHVLLGRLLAHWGHDDVRCVGLLATSFIG